MHKILLVYLARNYPKYKELIQLKYLSKTLETWISLNFLLRGVTGGAQAVTQNWLSERQRICFIFCNVGFPIWPKQNQMSSSPHSFEAEMENERLGGRAMHASKVRWTQSSLHRIPESKMRAGHFIKNCRYGYISNMTLLRILEWHFSSTNREFPPKSKLPILRMSFFILFYFFNDCEQKTKRKEASKDKVHPPPPPPPHGQLFGSFPGSPVPPKSQRAWLE